MSRHIPIISRDRPIPLSLTQQRLWFLQQLDPQDSSYNVVSALDLTGPLDFSTLQSCLWALVDRHEILRTAMVDGADGPLQEIHQLLRPEVRLVDLSDLDGAPQSERVDEISAREIGRPFDIAIAPLFRVTLIVLGPERHRLQIVMHHLITDGWSRSMLLKELSSLYTSAVRSQPHTLTPLPLQYADFAVWQASQVDSDAWRRQMAHWREALQGDIPRLRLSPVSGAGAEAGIRASSFRINTKAAADLRRVARDNRVTLFVVVLAVLKVLLHRRSQEKTLCVGIPSAGRVLAELEGLHGFFVNTLPLKTEVAADAPFTHLLRAINIGKLGALANEAIPFDRIVEELNPSRSSGENPFFDVVVNYIPWQTPRLRFGDAEAIEVRLRDSTPKFLLTVYIRPVGDELELEFVSRARDLNARSMDVIIQQFGHLLLQVTDSPETPVHALSLLAPVHATLVADPRRVVEEEPFTSVPTMFEDIARRTPEAEALCTGRDSTTYEQLSTRAGEIRHLLFESGVAKGDVVAVACRRDADLVASMLAVLSLGGVMLLVDPKQPHGHLSAVMKEARPAFILGHEEYLDDLLRSLGLGGERILSVESASSMAPADTLPDSSSPGPDDAAYIFFTSGTTGSPKGIQGSHKGLSHFLVWQRKQFGVGPDDRCPFTAALSFDPLLREIFLPLTSGGTLLMPPERARSSDRILRWLDENSATLLHSVPSLARTWIKDTSDGVALKSLRWTFFAGEVLTGEFVGKWRAKFPNSGQVVNLYGPTESTMVKSFFVVPDSPSPGVQPLGKALPQSDVLILNPRDGQCGVEEIGEIVIRSPYIAKGYVGSNGDSASGFGRNPFTADTRDLVYRTGDVGFVDRDGLLNWLGRRDHQVKVRGVRVEPDGVSAVLSTHHLVDRCITVVLEDGRGESHLVAFVESRDHGCEAELRGHVSEVLPGVMVPDKIVFVPEIPLTGHGKVDRSRLPMPDFNLDNGFREDEPFRDEIEATIAAIWKEVLQVEKVGRHDDFFDLGGHSLAATRILARINSKLDVNVSLADFFDAQTIREQAEVCRNHVASLRASQEDESVER